MATPFGFGDPFGKYPYASPFVTPEDVPWDVPVSIHAPTWTFVAPEDTFQNVPVSIPTPALPFVAPRDVLQNGPVPVLAPAFPGPTYPYEPFLAFPDLSYPYEPFENPSGRQSGQEIETAPNPFLPQYGPVPSSSSPQTSPPANDAARPCAIYSVPIPLSPAPTLSQNATGCPSNRHKIPQAVYDWGKKRWDYRPSEPILFHVNGHPGVNLGDALRNEFTGLDGRDDPMFKDGVDAFSCRLVFPGYPINSIPQIFTKHWDKDRTPIARSTLAYHVARKVEHYLDAMASSHTIDDSTDKQWEIGKGFMTLDNMFLVRLEHVTKGSYQPEIWVAM